jgi:hypothetical protein
MRLPRILVLFAAIVSVSPPVVAQTPAGADTKAIENLISDYAKSISLADTALAEPSGRTATRRRSSIRSAMNEVGQPSGRTFTKLSWLVCSPCAT